MKTDLHGCGLWKNAENELEVEILYRELETNLTNHGIKKPKILRHWMV